MAQYYDNVTKYVTSEYSEPFSIFILGYNNVTVLENLENKQITLKTHETDTTLKVQFPDEIAIIHNEIQTYDSQEPMPFRIAGYNGFLIREHKLNVYSSVLYLHPQAGRNDPGYYEYVGYGCEYKIKYRVIRLIEIDGQSIINAGVPGLLPLTPLMKPPVGVNSIDWLDKCVDSTFNAKVDTDNKNLLLAALGIFGSVVYDMEIIRQLLPEGIMQDFPLIQEFIKEARENAMAQGLERGMERGLERGQKKFAIDSILMLLNDKFHINKIQEIKPILEEIDDLAQLRDLLRAIPEIQDVDEFTTLLEYKNS